jgi:large subunit ribosomal protein L5
MNFQKHFKETVTPRLMSELGYHHPLAVPRVEKVIVACGVGRSLTDQKLQDEAIATLSAITGQKPRPTQARKAQASFKVRKGAVIGLMVTLRGKRMYDFLERLINVVLPRIRDFRGLSIESFDMGGNYTIGIAEQIAFPEISPDKIKSLHGLEISIITSARNPQEGRALLTALGFPFKEAVAKLSSKVEEKGQI